MDKPAGKLLRSTRPETWSASSDSSCAQFALFTEFAPRPPLKWVARWPAFITTPFKMLGILGWTRLPVQADVTGTVLQSAGSTDGFLTVDIQLDAVRIGNAPCDWSNAAYPVQICPRLAHAEAWRSLPRHLRIEAHGHAHAPETRQIAEGKIISTSGALKIDHDPPSFLELHVTRRTRIHIVH